MTRLEAQTEGIPLPHPSDISRPFWDGCRDGRLLFQRCLTCDHVVFEPAPMCRWCTSRSLQWEQSKGGGKIYSWTIAYRPQTNAFTIPYAPVIVDLDEGFQMLSNIIDCDTDDLTVGLRVQVDFRPVGHLTLPYFRPA
jgi:uncharacterized OB-fold protein